MNYPINEIRKEFPILNSKIYNKDLVYFDNGATTQRPLSVINSINDYYKNFNSNVHRGAHFLSNESTTLFENARNTVKEFINASSEKEIIFTKGTTESINLVAHSFGKTFVNENDEIIISHMEHHANIVPWQIMCEERKAKLKIIPINNEGEILFDEFLKLITNKTKLISITWISNVLGTINPIEKIIEIAHKNNIKVLIDAAQASPHKKIDVNSIDCDFLCFSGHKMYGPTGIGVLYGKENILNDLKPYQSGGEMIKNVSFNKTTYNDLPFKFEAGTPNIAGAIGLSHAIKFIQSVGIDNIYNYENQLLEYTNERLKKIEGINIYGQSRTKSSLISFLYSNSHPFDIGTLLDKFGIAIRTGHHCAQPIMDFYNIPGTARVSFASYNTFAEIDYFINSLEKVIKIL